MRNFRLLVLVWLILILTAVAKDSYAVPFKPGVYDPETGISRITGLPIAKIERPKGMDAPEPRHAAKLSGNYNCLILLIRYPDQGATQTSASFVDMFNQDNYNGTGSINNYFREVSYGNFGVKGTVGAGSWYTSTNNRAYYGYASGPARAAELVAQAVDAAEAAGVNFAPYDNNKDGKVDSLFIVHSGKGREATGDGNDIHSHKWDLVSAGLGARNYDGVEINAYCIQPELNSADNHIEIGVFCHEYGHLLGLPDLYDTTPEEPDSEGVGSFCLMGSGGWGGDGNSPEYPAHMCPWAKIYLGWITPTLITVDTPSKSIKQVETNPEVIKVCWTTSGSLEKKEYFFLENRRQVGFDRKLLGAGLLIWHIDENVIKDNMASNTVNGDKNRKGVDLEEADGLNHLDIKKNQGDAGDYFSKTNKKDTFDSSTNPNSNSNTGVNTKIAIRNISAPGAEMYVDILTGVNQKPLEPFIKDTVYNYPNPFNPDKRATNIRFSVEKDSDVIIEIFDVAGDLVWKRELRAKPGKTTVSWDGKNEKGDKVANGVYIYQVRTNGKSVVKKIVVLR